MAGLEYDSRRVGKDFVFFAFAGSRVDGRRFAQEAMARGALRRGERAAASRRISRAPWIEVEHGRRALATASRNFYGSRTSGFSSPASPAPTARPPRPI